MSADEKPYYGEWESCDGFYSAEIRTVPPDGPFPAMVSFEMVYGDHAGVGGTITAEDTEQLVAHLGAAAGWASFLTKQARAAASSGGTPKGDAE